MFSISTNWFYKLRNINRTSMIKLNRVSIALLVGLLVGAQSAQALHLEELRPQFAAELHNAQQTEFGLANSWIFKHIEKYITELDDSRLLSILADLDIVYSNSQIIALNRFSQDARTMLTLPSLALLLSAIANDGTVIEQLLESPVVQCCNIEKALVLSAKYNAAEHAIQILLNTGVHPYADNAKALFLLAHAKNIAILQLYLDAAVKYAIKMKVSQDLEMRIHAVQFTFSQSIYKEARLDILALLQEKYEQLIAGNIELEQETIHKPNPSKNCGCCTLL